MFGSAQQIDLSKYASGNLEIPCVLAIQLPKYTPPVEKSKRVNKSERAKQMGLRR